MDLDRVHINPIVPDPSAAAKYGSRDERAPSDHDEREDAEECAGDRIEISEKGRRALLEHAVPPDFDFARRALGCVESLPPERTSQLVERIASGYYTSRVVIGQVAARVVRTSRPTQVEQA